MVTGKTKISDMNRLEFLVKDSTVRKVSPFCKDWETRTRVLSFQQGEQEIKKHLGKAVSLNYHLLQLLEIFTNATSWYTGPVKVWHFL